MGAIQRAVGSLLIRLPVEVHGHEVLPLTNGFLALFCVLASFFLLLPAREDAGISLGTSYLPSLFVAGMLVTLLAGPAASAFLARHAGRHRGAAVRRLLALMSVVLLVFCVLYGCDSLLAAAAQPVAAVSSPHPADLLAGTLPPAAVQGGGARSNPSQPAPGSSPSFREGDPSLSLPRRWLRATFYVAANSINLIAISAVWLRCSDVFSSLASTRLFGVISAGATLGQLAGSLVAMAVCGSAAATSGGGGSGIRAQQALLLLSAMLMAAAGVFAGSVQLPPSRGPSASGDEPAGKVSLEDTSLTIWVQSSGAPSATGGRALQARPASITSGSRAPATAPVADPTAGNGAAAAASAGVLLPRSRGDKGDKGGAPSGLDTLRGLGHGFGIISSHSYLQLICAYLFLTYMVTSLLYFERSMMVALEIHGFAGRATFFAALSSYSALLIVTCQLFATGRLLQAISVPRALMLSPIISLVGLALIMLRPHASSVAAAELLRKVAGYAVTRPAREVLFTVVSPHEQYETKMVIDTVVQRLGDAAAAAAYQVLDVRLARGQMGVAGAAGAVAMLWLGMALLLGRRFSRAAQVLHTSGGGTAG